MCRGNDYHMYGKNVNVFHIMVNMGEELSRADIVVSLIIEFHPSNWH